MIDFIIVGNGLAGISFAEIALQNNKSIFVFDNNSQPSSRVAGGLYNPVVLKRFSEVWKAKEQIDFAFPLYHNIQSKLNVVFDFELPILRKLFSVEEQNNWFAASDKPSLSPFLSTTIIHKKYKAIDSPFGYGEVLHTGYLDTDVFLNAYQAYLKSLDILVPDAFRYEKLQITDNTVLYEHFQAKHIVFAEGFGMHANPYFKNLPLDGTKGELFIIKAPDLNLDVIINTSIFILPLGDNLFKVGATYNWEDKTDLPTEEGKVELVERIREILQCEFEIVSHFAGVRPTVKDRRPLLGTHPSHKNIHILNGLGTRGVMLAPAMALDLFEYIENQKPLDKSVDIRRYITSF